jgi:hypothetical protein
MTSKKNPDRSVGWVEHFAKPITTSKTVMGIASLHPSYEVESI